MRTPATGTIVSRGTESARQVPVLNNSGKLDLSVIPDEVVVNTITQEVTDAENVTVTPTGFVTATNVQEAIEQLSDNKLDGTSNLNDLPNKSLARNNLGLGTISTQSKNDVDIDGGSIDGTAIGAATPASGSFTSVNVQTTITSKNVRRGTGSPEGVVVGSIGDIFQRTDGLTGASTYIKETGAETLTGWKPLQTRDVQTFSYSAAVTPATSTYATVNIAALTGNITISAPTGTPIDGQILTFRLEQDSEGDRIITWASDYVFGTDITQNLIPVTPLAQWEMMFKYHAPSDKWRAVAIVRGF